MTDLRSLLHEHALAPSRDLDVDQLLSRVHARRVRRRLAAWIAALAAIGGIAVPVVQVLAPAGQSPSQSVHVVKRGPQPGLDNPATTSTTVSGRSGSERATGGLSGTGARTAAGSSSPAAPPRSASAAGTPAPGYTFVQVCSSGPSPFPGGGGPTVPPYCWQPDTVRVATGASVTWDGTRSFGGTVTYHTVTSTSANWSVDAQVYSNPNSGPGSFTYTFTKPGTYTFYCKLHAEKGSVIVTNTG